MNKVLIVDDNAFDRKMIQRAIAAKGVPVEFMELEGGHDAARTIAEITPKVAIVDIRMPGMDGFEVLESIRMTPGISNTPVLIVSGSEQAEDRVMAEQRGADGYFVKPPSASAYYSLGREIYDRYLCCCAD
ncbi:MAG: response regulator [Pseudomonadota bacterium]